MQEYCRLAYSNKKKRICVNISNWMSTELIISEKQHLRTFLEILYFKTVITIVLTILAILQKSCKALASFVKIMHLWKIFHFMTSSCKSKDFARILHAKQECDCTAKLEEESFKQDKDSCSCILYLSYQKLSISTLLLAFSCTTPY